MSAHPRSKWTGLCVSLCVVLAGCGEIKTVAPTQTVVVVDAEDGVREQTESLQLVVRAQGESKAKFQSTLERGEGDLKWPHALALEPKDGDVARRFEVEATALDADGKFVSRALGSSGYIVNKLLQLDLMLEDSCIGKMCKKNETCRAGECEDAWVDPTTLKPYDAKSIDDPMVVPGNDGGAGQGGGDKDAEVPDGSVDKNDGGGTSAGCEPNPDTDNEVCPEICPEICNAKDDDCDRRIDEGGANDLCQLAHADAACVQGDCVITVCVGDYRDCDNETTNGCEVPKDDMAHCGKCGQKCEFANANTLCVNGQCLQVSCEQDFADCDSDRKQCETQLNSVTDCGRCGTECENVANASPSCETGACGPGTCNKGFGDCNDMPDDGCEQSLNAIDHCGACDADCDLVGSIDDDCGSGSCVAGLCDIGYDNCDNDLSNGCESLVADTSCGACGVNCLGSLDNVSTSSCVSGACEIACLADYGDCDDDPLNGCEASLNSIERCSDCDTPCERPHTVTTCGAGTCEFVACEDGWGDCNGLFADGCEQDLDDNSDCGACDNDCAAGNKPYCSGRTCTGVNCGAGTGDCDLDGSSCETNLTSSAQNCGACGFDCEFDTASPNANDLQCVSSKCVPGCAAGYQDCNLDYHDGCERALDTLTDCGACGMACAIANAAETCANGSCKVMACDTDFGDCDLDGKSCETQLNTGNNCGGCGVKCEPANGVGTCSGNAGSRLCAVSVCNQGFANCDDQAVNGCETDIATPANCGGCTSKGTSQACVNLPNVLQTTCPTGSCQIQQCAADWVDCDGNVMNGCEQQLSVVGPCFPDTNCTKQTYQTRSYFFCSNTRTWSDARVQCNKQLRGDLVRIDDMTENTFLKGYLGADAWIGASDQAVEGAWRWADNSAQFWSGTAGGTPVMSSFSKWNAGEPNDGGANEDCAALAASTGSWNDQVCTTPVRFVCEVQSDLCPSDPNKNDPGQCGCGNLDTDSDSDGTANCHDNCPSDPAKVNLGMCGCGISDVDTDMDLTVDCNETCDSDPLKTAPGACGCGVVENAANDDGDSAPNCIDGCPLDATRTMAPCGDWTGSSNWTPATVSFVNAPIATLNCGTTTVDTSTTPATITNWCGTAPTPTVQTQAGGPDLVILPMRSLTINSGQTLRLIGTRPVVLAVDGPVLIDGTVDASGNGIVGGAGAAYSCGTSKGSAGAGSMTAGSGGGGGGYFSTGGKGGSTATFMGNAGGNGGVKRAGINGSLTPLYGGCGGGDGGGCANTAGAGGGAVQITATGTLTVSATGSVNAKGGAGANGCSTAGGGSGGGSGGSIVLEAPVIKNADSAISAAGGKGGNGAGGSAGTGGAGSTTSSIDGSVGGNSSMFFGNGSGGGGGGGYGGVRFRSIGNGGRTFASWTASNFTPQTYSYVQNVVISCNATFDSSGASPSFTTWCAGTKPTPVIITQSGGPDVVVVPMKTLTVHGAFTLNVIGTRPVIFAVDGDASIYGTVDGSAYTTVAGAGGNQQCGAAVGTAGGHDNSANEGSGGGGGAGNAATGGQGGRGNTGTGGIAGGAGAVIGTTTNIPLRGGCSGGQGGRASSAADGGAGGGGVQISSRTLVFVSGVVDVSGGGGKRGSAAEDGGGGGGSAGNILLEGYSFRNVGILRATGGGGGRGNASDSVSGVDGTDGRLGGTGSTSSQGGGGGGGGGVSGAVGNTGSAGSASTRTTTDMMGNVVTLTVYGGGGGGGGGSGGRTRQNVVAP